ncbi:phosphopantetheine-binding protein [Streptomyces tricolor]|nr:phosphopantetheine-binding protein [Streptomyces tricolor]
MLGRAAVPPHASFFALGGSSLQAARACTRIGKRAGRPVPLSSLYAHASAERLGAWLRSAQNATAAPAPADGIPLTATELVFLTRHLTAPEDRSGHCLMTWHLDGPLDEDAPGGGRRRRPRPARDAAHGLPRGSPPPCRGHRHPRPRPWSCWTPGRRSTRRSAHCGGTSTNPSNPRTPTCGGPHWCR